MVLFKHEQTKNKGHGEERQWSHLLTFLSLRRHPWLPPGKETLTAGNGKKKNETKRSVNPTALLLCAPHVRTFTKRYSSIKKQRTFVLLSSWYVSSRGVTEAAVCRLSRYAVFGVDLQECLRLCCRDSHSFVPLLSADVVVGVSQRAR